MSLTVNISTIAYDPLGYASLTLAHDNGFLDAGRRVNVVPTLDGGVAVDDAGATEADKTFALAVKPRNRAEAEQIQYLTTSYPQLKLAMRGGLFQVVPLSVAFTGVECTWNLRVVARLA